MEELLQKAENRIRRMPHVDAKALALQTIFPLIRQMMRQQAGVADAVDTNFRQIFMALHVANEESHFLDTTFQHITGLHAFVDELLLAAGFMIIAGDGTMKPAENIPSNILEKLLAFQQQGASWFQQYEAVRTAAEEALDEEDDDEDYDDDDDDDEDFDGEEVEASDEEPATEAPDAPDAEPVAEQEPANV